LTFSWTGTDEAEITKSQAETQPYPGVVTSPALHPKQMCQDREIKDSAPRENQAQMIKHLNSQQNDHSLYVLPTGSGKTKVVLMDAISRDVCNVIFVPLLAIQEDIFKEAQADYRLRMRFWNSINTDFASAALDANIVVASFEHATQAMISFFQCLERNGRLGFCFVDEVDIILHKYRTFRLFWSMCASCPLAVGQWREPPALCFSKRHKKQDRKEEQSFNKTLHSLLLFHVARNNVSATNLA